jgi:hypothetical protein
MSRWPLRFVAASTVVIAASYACAIAGPAGARAGAWLMALGNAGLAASTMALGARRLYGLCLATFAVIALSFTAALLLPANEAAGAWLVLGLPVRAAIVVYGAGILPLLVLPVAYALTFDDPRRGP